MDLAGGGRMIRAHIVTDNGDLVPFCPIHWDASRMNGSGECDECLDDAEELRIIRGVK